MRIRIKQNELLELLGKATNSEIEGLEIKLWQYSGDKGQFAKIIRIEKISEESQDELEESSTK